MRKILIFVGAASQFAAASALAATITTFDPPGSIKTVVSGLNSAGVITGYYEDSGKVFHGFIRATNGVITVFDVLGAGANKNPATIPGAINDEGAITGQYTDSANAVHSFVRYSDGSVTTFGPNITIAASGINNPGVVVGVIFAPATAHKPSVSFGFERLLGGEIVRFDGGALGTEIKPSSINNKRVIVGSLSSSSKTEGGLRGFLRAADKTMTLISFPGSMSTMPISINNVGDITGPYGARHTNRAHGFIRAADGTYTTFDPLGSIGTFPSSINGAGWITGHYEDRGDVFHGFVRTPNGAYSKFDPPNSTATYPVYISGKAIVAGYYIDNVSKQHGFVRTPK